MRFYRDKNPHSISTFDTSSSVTPKKLECKTLLRKVGRYLCYLAELAIRYKITVTQDAAGAAIPGQQVPRAIDQITFQPCNMGVLFPEQTTGPELALVHMPFRAGYRPADLCTTADVASAQGDQVMTSWLTLRFADYRYSMNPGAVPDGKGGLVWDPIPPAFKSALPVFLFEEEDSININFSPSNEFTDIDAGLTFDHVQVDFFPRYILVPPELAYYPILHRTFNKQTSETQIPIGPFLDPVSYLADLVLLGENSGLKPGSGDGIDNLLTVQAGSDVPRALDPEELIRDFYQHRGGYVAGDPCDDYPLKQGGSYALGVIKDADLLYLPIMWQGFGGQDAQYRDISPRKGATIVTLTETAAATHRFVGETVDAMVPGGRMEMFAKRLAAVKQSSE